jgi:predicted fused transcriptional regulator/phosphomethylpyrimidine kinase
MPTYLDTHRHIPGLTAEALAQAHQKDVEVGANYNVRYVRYWFDEATGRVYCLVEADTPEMAEQVHREAHGLVADEIVPVMEGA